MTYGAAASIHIIQNTLLEDLQEGKLPFWPTVVAVSALAPTLRAQCESLPIFQGYTR